MVLSDTSFTPDQVEQFDCDGFLVARGLIDRDTCARLRQVTEKHLAERIAPLEYEADLQYPGAPESLTAEGGSTVRRLRQAISRDAAFTDLVSRAEVTGRLRQLLGPKLVVPLAHHNCVMTKSPRFSSETGWHQDIRYWSFERPDLISMWTALGPETVENGCLHVIPGTHRMAVPRERLDEHLFLRDDLAENRQLIADSVTAPLEPGDVLFFHCRTFHCAGRNTTDQTKYSVVFTFREAANTPLIGSRSASAPELLIP